MATDRRGIVGTDKQFDLEFEPRFGPAEGRV